MGSAGEVDLRSHRFAVVLQDGERILWLGEPAAPVAKTPKERMQSAANWLFGAVAALTLAFGLFSKGLELLRSRPIPRWSDYGFGLFLVVVGLLVIYGAAHLAVSAANAGEHANREAYALTDKRALISRTHRKTASMTSIPILPGDWVTGDFGARGRIIFSRSEFYRTDEGEPAFDESVEVFKDIPDAEAVFSLIRKLQSGKP